MPTISKEVRNEIIIAAVVVTLIYQLGILLVLILVPLQIIYFRRGLFAQAVAACATFGLILVTKLLFFGSLGSFSRLVLSLLFFLFSAGSLVLWNMLKARYGWGILSFLLASLFFATVNSISFVYIQMSQEVSQLFLEQIRSISTQLGAVTEDNSSDLLRLLLQFALSTAWVSAGSILLINHLISILFSTRRPLPNGSAVEKVMVRLERMRLSVHYLWFFIMGWGLVLISATTDAEIISYVAWNIALFSALLYAIQGYSVALHVIKLKQPEMYKLFVWVSIVGIFVPILNVIFPVTVMLLGLSAHWVMWYKLEK